MSKLKLVILTGAGMSAESGISTFRDSDGLWEQYPVEEVASIDGYLKNPALVLDFYNQRRAQLANVEPNTGHKTLARLEKYFDVHIITQNIDNLHEQAGSTRIIHLHGELTKACSSHNKSMVSEIGFRPIQLGEKAKDGSQLRPYIVWFGEAVPEMDNAIPLAQQADIFVVIGTSLNVYPAAGLVSYATKTSPKYIIDPKPVPIPQNLNFTFIQKKAGEGSLLLEQMLLEKYHQS